MEKFSDSVPVQISLERDTIQQWLVEQLAEQLDISPQEVDIQARFESLGLDSSQAIILLSKAKKLLGFEISPLLLFHYPTIALLSQRLAEDLTESETEVFEI